MSEEAKKPYNPLAFPSPETERTYFEPGMSLRDWFAGQALAGFCANPYAWENSTEEMTAMSFAQADDMLVVREKAA